MQNIGTSNETLTPATDDLLYAKDVSQDSPFAILRKFTIQALLDMIPAAPAIVHVLNVPLTPLETTDETTGQRRRIPVPATWNGWKITHVRVDLATAGITGTSDYDVEINGTTIFTTKVTIDSTETSSVTAAALPVINAAACTLATNDIISIDCDAVASGTAGKGATATITLTETI